jgi:predicted Fe-Mo cluster-binding NifX family protein
MMKIAVITDDERTISRHFGRAPYYLVVTIEEGKEVARERRDKANHGQFAHEPHVHEHDAHTGHGHGPAAQGRHAQMAATIGDCQTVICGGMGNGAYQSLQERGLQPIVTDINSVDEAIAIYLKGGLVNRIDRLH